MQVPMNLIKIPSDWPQIYVLTMQPFSVQVHKPLHALSFYTVLLTFIKVKGVQFICPSSYTAVTGHAVLDKLSPSLNGTGGYTITPKEYNQIRICDHPTSNLPHRAITSKLSPLGCFSVQLMQGALITWSIMPPIKVNVVACRCTGTIIEPRAGRGTCS